MPSYQMQAPDGRTYTIDGPPNATDDQVRAEILRQYPNAGRASSAQPKTPSRTRGTGVGFIDTPLDVINEALIGIPEGAYNLAAKVTDPIGRFMFGNKIAEQAQQQRRGFVDAARKATVTQERPIVREAALSVAPAAVTSTVAGLGAKAAQGVPVVANILRAAQTGGVGSGRTAAQTAAMTRGQRVLALGERMTGGAGAGAATAALSDQDVVSGAAFGAGLPVVASVLKRVGGFAGDLTQMPRQKAAEIIRKSLGENVDAARAAFAQLSPNDRRMAERVMVDADIEPDAFFGLGQAMQTRTPQGATLMRKAGEREAQERAASIANITGGDTETQRRAALEAAQQGVNVTTSPMRDVAFANVSGNISSAPIVQALLDRAGEPGVRASTGSRALRNLARKIQSVTDEDGFIDPADLYTIRKEASDIIENLVVSRVQPSTGSKRRAAGVVTSVKQIVDDALGPEFKNYLATHRVGMSGINRQELASNLAQLAEEQPNVFVRAMRGNRSDLVEKAMGRGTGQYDIGQALDPAQYQIFKQAADDMVAQDRITALRLSGAGPAANLLTQQTPSGLMRGLAALGGVPYTPLGIAARGGAQMEKAFMAPRVERELANAFIDPQAMNRLMNTFPSKAVISEQVSNVPPTLRNIFAQGLLSQRPYGPTPEQTYNPADYDEYGNYRPR